LEWNLKNLVGISLLWTNLHNNNSKIHNKTLYIPSRTYQKKFLVSTTVNMYRINNHKNYNSFIIARTSKTMKVQCKKSNSHWFPWNLNQKIHLKRKQISLKQSEIIMKTQMKTIFILMIAALLKYHHHLYQQTT